MISSRFLGEYGNAYCLFFLAYEASNLERDATEIKRFVDDAHDAFHRALAHLSGLPETSADRKTKERDVYIGIAKNVAVTWGTAPAEECVRKMRFAHERARQAAPGLRVDLNIACDLMTVGNLEEAAAEFSKVIEAAPYMANGLLQFRAGCYAQLGREDEMLRDVEMVLNAATSESAGSVVEPFDLSRCALWLGFYLWDREEVLSTEKGQRYMELMKSLLTETKKRCSSGVPFTLEQLSLESEFFAVLQKHDRTFWDDYVASVSRGALNNRGGD
jgi:tetratricopeptide (TPR) repeat protein